MQNVDLKVFALITLATSVAVGILKKLAPKLVTDREEIFAVLMPVIFVVAAKSGGLFKTTDWVDALTWAIGSGIGAGATWDYAMKPAVAAFFSKKPASEPGEPKV